jgi:hypothetical protein
MSAPEVPQNIDDYLFYAEWVVSSDIARGGSEPVRYAKCPATGSIVNAGALLTAGRAAAALHGDTIAAVRLLELTDGRRTLPTDPCDELLARHGLAEITPAGTRAIRPAAIDASILLCEAAEAADAQARSKP